MIQIFSITLAAGEAREVAVTGEYFELRNAQYPIAMVELLDRTGAVISRLENPEQSDFVKPGRYETIRITNGATAQTIKHFYGSGDAGSRRTSGLVRIDGSSDVSVIDGEKNRTIAGGMFAAGVYAGAAAGLYSAAQLWNPAASGKNLIVLSLACHQNVAWSAIAYHSSAALATDRTVVDAANKLSAAAVGVGLIKVQAIAFPAFAATKMKVFSGVALDEKSWNVRGALVIKPGYGLSVVTLNVNTDLYGNFEWFEELV